MEYLKIAKSIISLKNADLKFRNKLVDEGKLSEGYNVEMENLHIQNAELLNKIIEEIGYPTIEKVRIEASESSWLIIQHSISKPEFIKKCAKLLEEVVNKNKSNEKNLAYLTDRIAVLEGNPQLYGTQFDWDVNGRLSPNLIDNRAKVNQRRMQIGLKTMDEQTKIIREQAKKENQTVPKNIKERKIEVDLWRKKVGWIK